MENKRDYYEVLGVDKNADEKTIKKAYRRKAKELHPDVNPSPDSEEKMKELNEAYEVLGDEQKKQAYDRFGHSAFNGNYGNGGYDSYSNSSFYGDDSEYVDLGNFSFFDDIFKFAGQGFSGRKSRSDRKSPKKGETIYIHKKISFLESVLGTKFEIKIDDYENCSTCNAKGYESSSDTAKCGQCNGQGFVTESFRTFFGVKQMVTSCQSCDGSGVKIVKKCSTCKGRKYNPTKKIIEVAIEPGVVDGSKYLYEGVGNPGSDGGEKGGVIIKIQVENDKYFRRDNDNLFINLPVSIKDIILEQDVKVPTPYEVKSIKMKSYYQNGTIINLKDYGIRRKHASGSLKVIIDVVIPEYGSKDLKKLKESLKAIPDSVNEDFIKKF